MKESRCVCRVLDKYRLILRLRWLQSSLSGNYLKIILKIKGICEWEAHRPQICRPSFRRAQRLSPSYTRDPLTVSRTRLSSHSLRAHRVRWGESCLVSLLLCQPTKSSQTIFTLDIIGHNPIFWITIVCKLKNGILFSFASLISSKVKRFFPIVTSISFLNCLFMSFAHFPFGVFALSSRSVRHI